ncbi:MAG: HK97 family phage prohead protease [Sedimentisphaerales bacterium]|jgi:HK97 family phage prohead protease
MLVKEFTSKSAVIDTEKRQIRFLASTPDIDRDRERILPSAFEKSLPGFMQNPVFLACHQHHLDGGEPPVIGKIIRAWIDEKVGLWIIVEFAKSELGEKYWQLYRDGFMKAVSVGFIPLKRHDEFIEGEDVRTFDEVELIEISACAVPSNRGALARSKANKLKFVEAKRDEKILEEIKAEYARQGRDFDAECEEFAEIVMTMDLNGGEVPDRKEIDYANLVRR